MFKFLRKYNKLILAVGGTLLLIVFLIPQAITSLTQRAAFQGATIATVGNNEGVSNTEWSQIQQEVQFMTNLSQVGLPMQPLGVIKDPEHWYLLVREAQQMGLTGLNPAIFIAPDQIAAQAALGGVNTSFVTRFYSRFFGVRSMIDLYSTAGVLSDRRMKVESERLLHEVLVQLVIIDADADATDATPSESELQEQLTRYQDDNPGEGEMGFGYRLPDRVKLDWITIKADSIRSTIENDSERFSGIALRKHWRQEAGRNGIPEVETGTAIPEAVRQNLLDRLTAEKLDDIAKWASDELQSHRRGFSQRDGYVMLPDEWAQQQLLLKELAEQIRDQYPGLELPAYQSTGDRWYAPGELADLTGIGDATTDKFGLRDTLSSLVRVAKEFGGSTNIFIQQDVAGPPLRGSDSDIFIFRIIDTDPARPPASIEEVRDDVTNDLKRMAHFQTLKDNLPQIESMAQLRGLLSVALENNSIVQPISQVSLCNILTGRLLRFPFPLPIIGSHEEATRTIIDRALELPRTRKLDSQPEQVRTFAFALEDRPTILVVRLENQIPLTQLQFNQLISTREIQGLLIADELNQYETIRDAFAFEALSRRHQFAFTRRTDDDDEIEETPATQTAAADAEDE